MANASQVLTSLRKSRPTNSKPTSILWPISKMSYRFQLPVYTDIITCILITRIQNFCLGNKSTTKFAGSQRNELCNFNKLKKNIFICASSMLKKDRR